MEEEKHIELNRHIITMLRHYLVDRVDIKYLDKNKYPDWKLLEEPNVTGSDLFMFAIMTHQKKIENGKID